MNSYKVIGKRIFYLRSEKHIKQKELAEMINRSPSYLCDIEKSRTTPSIKVIYKIADALNVEVWKLFQ